MLLLSFPPKQVMLPCPEGTFDAVSYLGEKLPEYNSQKPLSISDCPIYLTPKMLDQDWGRTMLRAPSLPNDGKVHHSIVFDSLIFDGTRKKCGHSAVEVYSPVVIYTQ